MDRHQLINAILTMDKVKLGRLVMENRPRKTIYFIACEPGGPEYLQLSNDAQGKRQLYWNLQGRYFDESGLECPASELKGWKTVNNTLTCFYVKELPFNVIAGGDVKFAFRGEVANMNHE